MIRTENISESEEQRMNKKIFKRAVAMMMAAVLTVGAALPSSNVFASGSDEEKDTKTLAVYDADARADLDEDEVVTAGDIVIAAGYGFDIENDMEGIVYEQEKVTVIYYPDQGSFDADKQGDYDTYYKVEPVSGKDAYLVHRTIAVKEITTEQTDNTEAAPTEDTTETADDEEPAPGSEDTEYQLNKLMKTKAELTRKLEQMQEENQSVSKLRESMDQEMDEYRKQKNQILDERDDALRESRNLRKEMEEMKRTIGELEKQIQERDSRELERQLLNQTYQTQSVEDVERTVPVNEGVAEEKKKTPGWQAGYQAVVPNRYGGTQIVQIEHIRKKGPEHLLALAGKKCFRSKAKYNLIQQMKEADLSKSQMEQIQVAIESGLTDTEVSDIINSGFDVEEMAQAIQILLADKMYQ